MLLNIGTMAVSLNWLYILGLLLSDLLAKAAPAARSAAGAVLGHLQNTNAPPRLKNAVHYLVKDDQLFLATTV